MPEFLPWYQPGTDGHFVRCSECAALLVEGDAELHVKWHEDLNAALEMWRP